MTDAPSTQTPGTPYGGASQPKPPGGAAFFDWVRSLGFVRGQDRWLAGVCGAIAARTGLDPLIVRGIAVVVAILGGPIFFLYAVGWALMPDQSGRSLVEQAVNQVFEPAMVAVGGLLLLTFVPWMQGIWWQGPPEIWGMPGWLEVLLRTSWAIGLTVAIILLVIYIAKRVPSPRTRAGEQPKTGYPNTGTANTGTATTPYPTSTAPTAEYPTAAYPDTASANHSSSAQPPLTPSSSFVPPIPPVPDPPAQPSQPSLWDDLTGRNPQSSAPYGGAPSGSSPYVTKPTPASAFDPNVYRELHRRKHLGAGFISVVAGLALSAGAVAASFVADGSWSSTAFLVGAAAALAVIALGIVIAGIRGKEGGWLNFFSIVLAATMLGTAFIPTGTEVVTFGDPTWQYNPSDPTGFAMIAGAPTIDLTAVDDTPSASSHTVEVWLGFGDVELVLPENRTVVVEAGVLAGEIDYDAVGEADPDRGGVLVHDTRIVSDGAGTGVTTVRVWTGFGQVTINPPAEPALR